MSVHPMIYAVEYVRDNVRGSSSFTNVAKAIAGHVDERGIAIAGAKTLAIETGMERSRVVQERLRLVAAGHLCVTRYGPGHAAVYSFPQPVPPEHHPVPPEHRLGAYNGLRAPVPPEHHPVPPEHHPVPPEHHPVPPEHQSPPGGGTTTYLPLSPRSGEGKGKTTTTGVLLEHAVAVKAAPEVQAYMSAEAVARPIRVSEGAVRCGIEKRIDRSLVAYQDHCGYDELLAMVLAGRSQPITDRPGQDLQACAAGTAGVHRHALGGGQGEHTSDEQHPHLTDAPAPVAAGHPVDCPVGCLGNPFWPCPGRDPYDDAGAEPSPLEIKARMDAAFGLRAPPLEDPEARHQLMVRLRGAAAERESLRDRIARSVAADEARLLARLEIEQGLPDYSRGPR